MLTLIKVAHAGQTRDGGTTPYWTHPVEVAVKLQTAVDAGGEVDAVTAARLQLVALGHDLYEDTSVTPAEVRGRYGEAVDRLIRGLTNWDGDNDRRAYLESIVTQPEEARLVKLADLSHNVESSVSAADKLGADWLASFLRPVAEEMYAALRASRFADHPQTASVLFAELELHMQALRAVT
jgi:(p)ppGpp synthase/HD superfamily hydrolase